MGDPWLIPHRGITAKTIQRKMVREKCNETMKTKTLSRKNVAERAGKVEKRAGTKMAEQKKSRDKELKLQECASVANLRGAGGGEGSMVGVGRSRHIGRDYVTNPDHIAGKPIA